jgi:hypothetical protein
LEQSNDLADLLKIWSKTPVPCPISARVNAPARCLLCCLELHYVYHFDSL